MSAPKTRKSSLTTMRLNSMAQPEHEADEDREDQIATGAGLDLLARRVDLAARRLELALDVGPRRLELPLDVGTGRLHLGADVVALHIALAPRRPGSRRGFIRSGHRP